MESLEDIGWIKREKGLCRISDKHKFELFRDRQKHIIEESKQNVIFRPSQGYCLSFYNPQLLKEDIIREYDNLEDRIKDVEQLLKNAGQQWLNILAKVRNNKVRNIWETEILQNNNIYTPLKLNFCLYIILKINENDIHKVIFPKKSSNEFWETLDKLIDYGLYQYIIKKYNNNDIKKIRFEEKMNKEYKKYGKLLDKIYYEILDLYEVNTLEHMIVIDFPFLGKYNLNKFVKEGWISSIEIDQNETLLDSKRYNRNRIEAIPQVSDYQYRDMIKKINIYNYVNPPFFKEFFKLCEQEFIELKLVRDRIVLEELIHLLDETAENIKIPQLPDNVNDLM